MHQKLQLIDTHNSLDDVYELRYYSMCIYSKASYYMMSIDLPFSEGLAKGSGSEALAQKVCGRVVEVHCMMVSVFCDQSMTFRKDIRPITGIGCRLVGSAQVTTLSHLNTAIDG